MQIIRGTTKFDGQARVGTIDLDPRAPSWRLSGLGSTIERPPGPGQSSMVHLFSRNSLLIRKLSTRRGYAESGILRKRCVISYL